LKCNFKKPNSAEIEQAAKVQSTAICSYEAAGQLREIFR